MEMEQEGTQDPTQQEELQQEPENQEEGKEEPEKENPEPESEQYEPNFKYKYKDEEFEFDEKVKGFIKDKETEQFFRDMVTAQKAHSEYKELGGIREIQEKFQDYEGKVGEFDKLNQEIDQLSGLLGMGTPAGFEAFRNFLGINKEMVMKWAVEEAQASQDPQQAQMIEAQRQMQEQNFNLQYQNSMMQNNMEAQESQQRNAELDSLLGSSDVSKAYDNLVGTPGSFRQAVIEHGIAAWNMDKKVLSVPEAVQAVEQRFQGLIANQNSGTNQQVAQNPKQTQSDPERTVVVRQEGKTTIPSVGSGGSSPAKKKFTTLDDLRSHAKSL
jgi:hypothetical protein